MKDSTVSDLYRRIGQTIRQLRKRRTPPTSQEALAKSVGVSRVSVANMERGHHRIQIHVLYEIAHVLGVEPHDLLPHAEKPAAGTPLPRSFSEALSQNEQTAVARLLSSERRGGGKA